jgi:cytochrome c oxidase assembly factor CtaG
MTPDAAKIIVVNLFLLVVAFVFYAVFFWRIPGHSFVDSLLMALSIVVVACTGSIFANCLSHTACERRR